MTGGEYEPNDSRNVTLRPNEPGKPDGWRADDAPEDPETNAADALEPADSRHVTEEGVPEPGSVPGWRDKQARGEQPHDPAMPPGVPQEGKPFSAEEAAEAKR